MTVDQPAPDENPSMRLVIAPDGMAWVGGDGRYPGMWEDAESAQEDNDQSHVRYPVPDGDTGWSVVAVPTDEMAPMADLMSLAVDVEQLRSDLRWLHTALTVVHAGIGTYLDSSRGRKS